MTFWKTPGYPKSCKTDVPGKNSQFLDFGELRMSNWHVTKHRACQSKQVWDTEHRMGFRAQLIFNCFSPKIVKSTCHSKFGSQVLFFVEGGPKSLTWFFWTSSIHFSSIHYSCPCIFPAVFHPCFIHSAPISSHIHPLSSVLHPCFIHNLYPLPIPYSLFSPIKFNSV